MRQDPRRHHTSALLKTGLRQQAAYRTLTRILSAGPRLTGSPEAEAAVELMVQRELELGATALALLAYLLAQEGV